jgi:hypothetical protein
LDHDLQENSWLKILLKEENDLLPFNKVKQLPVFLVTIFWVKVF